MVFSDKGKIVLFVFEGVHSEEVYRRVFLKIAGQGMVFVRDTGTVDTWPGSGRQGSEKKIAMPSLCLMLQILR